MNMFTYLLLAYKKCNSNQQECKDTDTSYPATYKLLEYMKYEISQYGCKHPTTIDTATYFLSAHKG